MLLPYGGFIRMGDDCSDNPFTILYGHGGLAIGSQVRIAAHSVIVPANHNFSDPARPIRQQGLTMQGVWIGSHVTILDGVRIGSGSVIAAGSVVTHDVESISITGGMPARLLKRRGE